jgi:N utilization substance protein A
MDQIASVAEVPMESFFSAGFESLESIVQATDEELMAIRGMTESKIGDIRLAVNMLAPGLEAELSESEADEPETETVEEEVAETVEAVEEAEEEVEEETDEADETETETETPAEGEDKQ